MKNCYSFSIPGKYKSVAEFLLTEIITQFPKQFIDNKVNNDVFISSSGNISNL